MTDEEIDRLEAEFDLPTPSEALEWGQIRFGELEGSG